MIKHFYAEILGLEMLMGQGWIITLGSQETMPLQISFATEGGSGTPAPYLSIKVDNLDEAPQRIKGARSMPEYGSVTEPWRVRRFYVRDPLGKLENISVHAE